MKFKEEPASNNAEVMNMDYICGRLNKWIYIQNVIFLCEH